MGGADQSKFSLTASGVLSLNLPPNFEAPTDANGDNIYAVIVQASDGNGGSATQTITVIVTAINDNPPVITTASTKSVSENTTAVLTVAATDADLPPQAITFSIVGGADQAKFNISSGGALSFNTPPDFEAPADANGDNVYVVIVQASDGSLPGVQAILVTVTNIDDPFLAGDYNASGTVDAADYVVWRNTLGQMGHGLAADGNGNGIVDQADYNVWRANFGRSAAASGASTRDVVASTGELRLDEASNSSTVAVTGPLIQVQMIDRRSTTYRSARRSALLISKSHDDALQAWLATRSMATHLDAKTDDHHQFSRGRESEAASETVAALDLAFAAL